MTVINIKGKPLVNRLYDAIGQFPEGLVSAECYDLFPEEAGDNKIHAALSAMARCGVLKRDGKRTSPKTGKLSFIYKVDGPLSKFSWVEGTRPQSSKPPTDKGLKFRLDQALAKIEELAKWKEDAVARFPDLAVPPSIVTARAKVAAIYRADGDELKAAAIEAGKHDNTPILRAAASIIEDLAA